MGNVPPRTSPRQRRRTDTDRTATRGDDPTLRSSRPALTRFAYAVCFVATSLSALSLEARTPPNLRCFEIAAQQNRIELDLLLAVSKTESNWNSAALSHTGDIGMMQIQWPQTARHLGVHRSAELLNPCLNIALGATYLRELLDRFDQDETRALAAYNYGPTRIGSRKDIPAGARRYVERVRSNRHALSRYGTAKTPTPATPRVVTRFAARHRALAYAKTLNNNLVAARVDVVKRGARYHVEVAGSPTPTATDRALLSAVGAFSR